MRRTSLETSDSHFQMSKWSSDKCLTTSKEFERNGILFKRELCSLLETQGVARRRAGKRANSRAAGFKTYGVGTTPKTASKAAVFCRLPTDKAVTVGKQVFSLCAQAPPAPFSPPSLPSAHLTPVLVGRAQGGLTPGPEEGELDADFCTLGRGE